MVKILQWMIVIPIAAVNIIVRGAAWLISFAFCAILTVICLPFILLTKKPSASPAASPVKPDTSAATHP